MPFPPHAPKMISDKLDDGRLPRTVTGRMYARFDGGQICEGCETSILRNQVDWEFEVEGERGRSIHFDLGCAGLWEAERRKRGWL